jgi:glutathione synthase/RimK-type ligase-like ATP-grasp enzyme
MMRDGYIEVALATCQHLQEPDPDAALLESALEAAGVHARHVPWDDPSARFGCSSLCVIRSTWNYTRHLERFLNWAETVSRQTELWNPLEVIRWNVRKRYLEELTRAGINAVPTVYVPQGAAHHRLAEIMEQRRWNRVVIKPEVSAASAHTHVIDRDQMGVEQEELFGSLVTTREMMVQPYIESVEDYGERAVVWIDGEITHAVRKSPRFACEDEEVSEGLSVADDERALALAALGSIEGPLLYGRVDIVRDDAGVPMVMELELVEPSLFLAQSRAALERLTDAICQRVALMRL